VCRRKKREVLKRKVDETVEHYTKNESKKYYKTIQEFKPRINACRNAEGKLLTEKEDIQRRWKEYLQSVFMGNPDDTDSVTFFTSENEDIQPSYEEVTAVIKCLKTIRRQEQTK
jgi:hypothetical protein